MLGYHLISNDHARNRLTTIKFKNQHISMNLLRSQTKNCSVVLYNGKNRRVVNNLLTNNYAVVTLSTRKRMKTFNYSLMGCRRVELSKRK